MITPIIVGRDRVSLVEQSLAALTRHWEGAHPAFLRDPLTVEFDDEWLRDRGVQLLQVPTEALDPEPRIRVATMRLSALHQCATEWALCLDSDVEILPGIVGELKNLVDFCDARGLNLATPGDYAGYREAPYLMEILGGGKTLRSHALGGCLLVRTAATPRRARVPEYFSWDTWLSLEIGRKGIVTSRGSYCRHLGNHTGMCAFRGIDLDWADQHA